jgi:hypothetical protein
MRKRELMGVVVGAVAGALGLTGSAAAETRPALTSVIIEGSAVVGERLLATFEAAGDPPTTIEYKWRAARPTSQTTAATSKTPSRRRTW